MIQSPEACSVAKLRAAEKSLRHKLAVWYSKQLPKDHPLLK